MSDWINYRKHEASPARSSRLLSIYGQHAQIFDSRDQARRIVKAMGFNPEALVFTRPRVWRREPDGHVIGSVDDPNGDNRCQAYLNAEGIAPGWGDLPGWIVRISLPEWFQLTSIADKAEKREHKKTKKVNTNEQY
jgi:hypothetical protein